MIYLAGIIAMSPFVLVFAVMAKALRSKRTPEMGTLGDETDLEKSIGYDDNDPGVDVDIRYCSNCKQRLGEDRMSDFWCGC